MTARAWHSSTDARDYGELDSGDDYVASQLLAGERIGAPLPRTQGRRILRRSAAAAVALGGGWAYWTGQLSVPPWLTETITSALQPAQPGTERKVAAPVAPPAPEIMQPLATTQVAPTPGTDPAAVPTDPAAADAADAAAAAPAPLPQPLASPADPYTQRASAVGLHPDVSRVLLEKMTAVDYKNAAIAIKTALAETPDSGVYTWPKERKGDMALFEVHFVAGAPTGCRRYVVAVTKTGWLTTALPVEKCGKGVKAAVN
ncbi:MAG: hypothetical protein ABL901_14715 [Hyphomicrobiaceae bacterium]